VPLRAQGFVHCQLRWRASRPQLKRDPLGAHEYGCEGDVSHDACDAPDVVAHNRWLTGRVPVSG